MQQLKKIKEYEKKIGTCICITESFCWTSEINTTLLLLKKSIGFTCASECAINGRLPLVSDN